jgi:RNA polymerase sigma factor (TIGR02999 family)
MAKLSQAEVTRIVKDTRSGSAAAAKDLFVVLYDELRALAASFFRRERAGHTLQPTALVHEAYVRLVDAKRLDGHDRAHFLAVVAKVMRQVLIDHARRKGAAKRGGEWVKIVLDDCVVASGQPEVDVIVFEEILTALEVLDARKAKVVELRFFAGMTIEEAALALGISPKTVEADWYMARAWLRSELKTKGLAPP